MPEQLPEALWTFDGMIPPRLLMARVGVPVLMRHYNGLPVDVTANRGFGMHTISTHEHNGHNPAESDGFAGAFFFPGQYYDYRWPMSRGTTPSTPAPPIRAPVRRPTTAGSRTSRDYERS